MPQIPTGSSFGRWLGILVLVTAGVVGWRLYGDRFTSKESKTLATAATREQPVAPIANAQANPSPIVVPADVSPRPMEAAVAATPAMPEQESVATVSAKPADNPFAELLVLDPVAAKKTEHLQRRERLLRKTVADGKWNDYLDLLRRSMAAEFKKSFSFDQPQSYDRFISNPVFYSALLQATFIAGLPEDARNMIQDYTSDRDFYLWLLTTPEALEEWQLAVRPEDKVNNALKSWAVMQRESLAARDKYRSLALACALVFDQEFKPVWNGETLSLSGALRFNSYQLQDERGELATRLTQMSVRDLTWVVGAPVPESEMAWARKNMRLKQREWGRSYGMVPYDMEKAVSGKQKKPYEMYTFEEILKKGGICGDRTYFGVNTARSLGIPAAEISGDGPMGGHAWMRWKADDYTWKEDGRIGGYGAGRARDPQTGRMISELEFARRSDRRANSENLNLRGSRFLWFSQLHEALGEKGPADVTMDFAVSTNRGNAEFWQAKLAYWSRTRAQAPVLEWAKFIDAWKREFSEDAELIAESRKAEDQFIFPRMDGKSVLREMRADARSLENRREGPPPTAEEIAALYERQAQALAKDKNYDAIRSIYHRAFREHGEDPAAFKRMARDYFGLVKADATAKLDAAREIETAFERFIETRDLNWFVTGSQNSALQLVAECWKEAGQPERAERMVKEIERRAKRAKRDAL